MSGRACGMRLNGAAPESNRPSRGLHDRTGFEDQLGHRAHAAPSTNLAVQGLLRLEGGAHGGTMGSPVLMQLGHRAHAAPVRA
jgi:hypothetical protein